MSRYTVMFETRITVATSRTVRRWGVTSVRARTITRTCIVGQQFQHLQQERTVLRTRAPVVDASRHLGRGALRQTPYQRTMGPLARMAMTAPAARKGPNGTASLRPRTLVTTRPRPTTAPR